MDLPLIDNYLEIFLSDTPLIDVRAPVEFSQGAFPTATNLPLMEDDEREQVGIRYKQMGQGKAIELGNELVSGETRERRIYHWINFTNENPQGALYCFRGGLRSRISQQWIYETTGVLYPRVSGGYKALRRFLIDELESATTKISPLIVGGRTGSGKTTFLQQFRQQVDLEGIFHHRGSAFGRHAQPQPSQIDVENGLAIQLLKHLNSGNNYLLFEDEAANIGSRRIPTMLLTSMQQSPIVVLEVDKPARIENIYREYITDSLAEYMNVFGEGRGFNTWAANLSESLDKIQRRLGGVRHRALKEIMDDAIQRHTREGDPDYHRAWIERLLTDYYDPMYDYQIENKSERIIFRGDSESVRDYLLKEKEIK